MPVWRDDKILELANQLTYSPAEKRREQLGFAIALLPAIEPATIYPWDFVHFRITGFQSRAHVDHTVPGKILRADLATLIEFLSDTLSIKVEEAAAKGDGVLLLEEVTRKFNVSSKTIQRWRKQGLIALRYVYPDGRRRLGFLESAITRFADANKTRVEKSATFKQLTEDEKQKIIEMARQFAAHGQTSIKDISRQIARHLQRSPETIRYTIRRYDRDHPECPILPDAQDSVAGVMLQPASPAPAPMPSPPATAPQKIDFMPNPLFAHPDAGNIILKLLPSEALTKAQASVASGTNAKANDPYITRIPRDLPAFLQDIFRQPVMPQELETDAFRRMNYLKYKAAQLLEQNQAEAASELLSQVRDLKNLILQSNLRVAVHVARKHQRPDRPLMELVSDATIWLMRAIEKFDFARGGTAAAGNTRFSTYASFAIMKNFARARAEQLTRRDSHLLTGQEEILHAVGERSPEHVADQLDTASLHSDLRSVIEELPERERELLAHHYGLDKHDKDPTTPALSLSQIGDKMGITKARVRQLEARALRRLRLLLEARRDKLRNSTK